MLFKSIGMFRIRRSDTAALQIVQQAADEIFDKRILNRGPATRLQTMRRPKGTPSWAWGLTYGNPAHIWLNPDIKAEHRRLYAASHEPGHAIDDDCLSRADRRYFIKNFLNTQEFGWNQGHYDSDYCEKPREAFADMLARAMAVASGAGVDFDASDNDSKPVILRGFFRTHGLPSKYAEFLDWLAKRLAA